MPPFVFADPHASTTDYDLYGERQTHWLETIEPWNEQDKEEFLKDFWYKPEGYIRTRTFPPHWGAFKTINDEDLYTREVLDCIHCGQPVVNMMRYMRAHAATCPKLKHFQLKEPTHNLLCPKCNDTCKRNLTMEVHLKYNHYCKDNNESEEFHCDQCNYTVFPDLERLHYHRRLHYHTPVFKTWNESHTIPWTISFKEVLPKLFHNNTEEKYEQDMSTDELDTLLQYPHLFDEGSLAIEQFMEREINESLEARKIILSGNTQWQVDIIKKYENMSTQWLSTRSIAEMEAANIKHYMGERKKLGLEVDYFRWDKYSNKYTQVTDPLDDIENRKKYRAAHDWNKTRVEAFEEFDRWQQHRKYSILCNHMSIPYTTERSTGFYDEYGGYAGYSLYRDKDYKIECSHYSPPSKQDDETSDPDSKDWDFTPL